MRTLAIDLGTRRVGLALSDEGGRFATPYDVLNVTHPDQAVDPILKVIEKEGVERVVLGLPLNMDGSEGPRAQSARAYARNLAPLGLPVLLWDERWSTASAERDLIAQNWSRAKRQERIDSHAAAVILQAAIDRLAGGFI